MMPPDIDMMILQVSRPQDHNDTEKALVADGLLPITLFAGGPQKAFLIGARAEDLDMAFAAAKAREDGFGADRLAARMRVFRAVSDAINTDFKYLADPSDFPNNVTYLFVEALTNYGFASAKDIEPCAVRYLAAQLETPDFERAPPDEEEAPLAPPHDDQGQA